MSRVNESKGDGFTLIVKQSVRVGEEFEMIRFIKNFKSYQARQDYMDLLSEMCDSDLGFEFIMLEEL